MSSVHTGNVLSTVRQLLIRAFQIDIVFQIIQLFQLKIAHCITIVAYLLGSHEWVRYYCTSKIKSVSRDKGHDLS